MRMLRRLYELEFRLVVRKASDEMRYARIMGVRAAGPHRYPVCVGVALSARYWPGLGNCVCDPELFYSWFISGGIRFYERERMLDLIHRGQWSHTGPVFGFSDGSAEFHSARESGWKVEPFQVLRDVANKPGGKAVVMWIPLDSQKVTAMYLVSCWAARQPDIEYDYSNIALQCLGESIVGRAFDLHVVPDTPLRWMCSEGFSRLIAPMAREWDPRPDGSRRSRDHEYVDPDDVWRRCVKVGGQQGFVFQDVRKENAA